LSVPEIELTTADGPMPVYVCRPAGGPAAAAVIVLQEAFGVTPHIQDVADRAAQAGYVAVAPSLFHRTGSPIADYADMDTAIGLLPTLSDEGLTMDVQATLDFLADEGIAQDKVAIVGFCMGGSVSYVMGARMPLLAAVTFYGSGVRQGRFGMPSMLDLAPTMKSPWLGLYGDLDKGIPVDQVEELRAATAGAPVPTRVVRYPNAGHGFHCNDRPAAYDRDSAIDGWATSLAFIAGQLG
jgi:carboxymethylenebutenolidase